MGVREIREARRVEKREGALVCDVHGVACFKPEKKAKWKHVNTRSCSFKKKLVFLPSYLFLFFSNGKFHLRSQHLDRSLRLQGSQLDH